MLEYIYVVSWFVNVKYFVLLKNFILLYYFTLCLQKHVSIKVRYTSFFRASYIRMEAILQLLCILICQFTVFFSTSK